MVIDKRNARLELNRKFVGGAKKAFLYFSKEKKKTKKKEFESSVIEETYLVSYEGKFLFQMAIFRGCPVVKLRE